MQMNVWDDQKIPSNKPKAQSMKLSTGTRARKREHRRSQALLAFTKRWPYLLILLGAIMSFVWSAGLVWLIVVLFRRLL